MGAPLLGCVSHKLNLAVNNYIREQDYEDCLHVVDQLMLKLRNPKLAGRLRQVALHVAVKCHATHWTSAFTMLERYVLGMWQSNATPRTGLLHSRCWSATRSKVSKKFKTHWRCSRHSWNLKRETQAHLPRFLSGRYKKTRAVYTFAREYKDTRYQLS